ncbi:MAG: hypothetical protein V3V31_03450 [Methylococcales bacterium]
MEFFDNLMTNWHLKQGIKKLKKAERSRGKRFDRLIRATYQHFEGAMEQDPNKLEALKYWGQALSLSAQRNEANAQLCTNLYKEAVDKFSEANNIDPDDIETIALWGETLTEKAGSAETKNRDQIYLSAYKKFSSALKKKGDDSGIVHAWGLGLYNQAGTKDNGEEAQQLYSDACEKYSQAFTLDARNPEVLIDWGVTLMEQARQASSVDAVDAELYDEAKQKFLDAEEFEKGIASYNLACLHAVQGDADKCESRLKTALKSHNLPRAKHIENDLDLLNVRELPWYSKFIKKARKRFKD